MIATALAVLNSKGGVGKTSVSSALASFASSSGWKVLVIDMDPQGNMAREFGYTNESDGGAALFEAVTLDRPLRVLDNVRPNLSVVPGGRHTRYLAERLMLDSVGSTAPFEAFSAALESVAEPYDLVVIDCPPSDQALHRAISSVAHYVLIPTTGDASSIDGLYTVFEQIKETRKTLNPSIELLGIVVTFIAKGSTAMDKEVRDELRSLLGPKATLFSPTIRESRKSSIDLRKRGIQPVEYERLKILDEMENPFWQSLRTGEKRPRYSAAASGLASDYQALVNAVLSAFTKRQEELGFA